MKNFKNLMTIAVIGAGVAVTGLTGCANWDQKRSERTTGRMVDDHHVTASVKHDLAAEPVFKFGDVDVKTFDGAVQLSGFVTSEEQKRRAGEIAQRVPGVTQVMNNISLKPTGRDDGRRIDDRDGRRYDDRPAPRTSDPLPPR